MTIVFYCSSIANIGSIFMELLHELGSSAYAVQENRTFKSRMIHTYHKHIPESDKDYILSEIVKPQSTVRMVIASSAFGSGVDIPDIRLVYCFDSAKNVTDLWQAIGRAGRDGEPTETHIMYSNRAISSCDDTLKACLKEFISNTDECIRFRLLSSFTLSGMDVTKLNYITSRVKEHLYHTECPHCSCCTNCKTKCEWNYQTYLQQMQM